MKIGVSPGNFIDPKLLLEYDKMEALDKPYRI
jgi:hypothetical protein